MMICIIKQAEPRHVTRSLLICIHIFLRVTSDRLPCLAITDSSEEAVEEDKLVYTDVATFSAARIMFGVTLAVLIIASIIHTELHLNPLGTIINKLEDHC